MKLKFSLLTAFTLSACTFHPPSPPSPEERQKEFVHCFREEMRPTDAQMKQLEEKVFASTEGAKATAKGLEQETNELEKLLETPSIRDPELMEHFKKVAALKEKLSEDHFQRMLVLRSALTEEQVKKFLVCKRKMGPPVLPHE